MQTYEKFYLVIIAIYAISCSTDNQSTDILPSIDVRKNYPEKEIILTDIAHVSYVHLSAKNENYLYKGKISYVTENTIVVGDNSSGSILFFSKDGSPKSRFNRYGAGPEEYSTRMFNSIIFDETADDVYLLSFGMGLNFILVYSSTGEFRRKINIQQEAAVYKIYSFDEQSLLVYDSKRVFQRTMKSRFKENSSFEPIPQSIDSSFFIISKTDGNVMNYVIMPNNDMDLSYIETNSGAFTIPVYNRVARSEEGFYLCNHETDTVFLYKKDRSLTPVLCQVPLVSDLSPMIILDNCADAGKYQFMAVRTLVRGERLNESPKKYLLRDKETGKVFSQKIIIPEYKGKKIFISAEDIYFNGKETQAHFELNLFDLKQAYDENRLGGKLKELVATLDEYEDNNVFMFVSFKQN